MKINQSVSSSPQTQTHRLLEVEVDGEHHEGVGAAGAQDHHVLHIAVNRDEAPAAHNTPSKDTLTSSLTEYQTLLIFSTPEEADQEFKQ